MKKKMRKFAEGGFSAAQEEYLGGADRTDPYILARMRSAVPDAKEDYQTATGKNPSISDDTRSRALKYVEEGGEVPVTKTAPNNDIKSAKKANINDMPEKLRSPDYKAPSVVKMVSKEVTKPTPRSPAKMIAEESEYAIKPSLQSKGERLMKMFGMKKGGSVSSASKRADGCAIRGKTRA